MTTESQKMYQAIFQSKDVVEWSSAICGLPERRISPTDVMQA